MSGVSGDGVVLCCLSINGCLRDPCRVGRILGRIPRVADVSTPTGMPGRGPRFVLTLGYYTCPFQGRIGLILQFHQPIPPVPFDPACVAVTSFIAPVQDPPVKVPVAHRTHLVLDQLVVLAAVLQIKLAAVLDPLPLSLALFR